jgi:hypothetical protein
MSVENRLVGPCVALFTSGAETYSLPPYQLNHHFA